MRAPLSWLRDFTPLDAPSQEIAEALNQLGLEVDDIHEPGKEISGVVAARILDVVPHPDADKIRLADIDFGSGQLRVVCGAPNIEAGMVVPFAKVGAVLPGDFKITKRKIRGVVSEGMLCSPRELGLGDDHGGILALDDNSELGRDVREILGLNDTVFELSITPNRPDAMGIVGVARDLAAHFGLPFEVADAAPGTTAERIGAVTVHVEDPDRCPRFVARVAQVVMGDSPAWLQRRLTLAGMRPISNVVDVTNYIMLERCRPLHAFDLGRLAGRGIVVRCAAQGESMMTLDGVERPLASDDLLICDAVRAPQAIAGIMGGRESEVDESTTEVLIESAYFAPSGIAKTSKRLGLRSEASARFERGVDPNGVAAGADAAIALLAVVANGVAATETIDVYPNPIPRRRIAVRTGRVNAILGTDLKAATVRSLIEPLGITTTGTDDDFVAEAPTWRPDLEREIDIVEEVARRFGLQNIKRTVASAPAGSVGRLTSWQRARRHVADALVGAGYSEGMTLPLVALTDLAAVGVDTDRVVRVANPLRVEESVMRPSLRPGLLDALARNAARGNPDVALFELGTVFFAPDDDNYLPTEHTFVAGVRAGSERTAPRRHDRGIDVGDALDAVQAIVDALGLANVRLEAATSSGWHPARAAEVFVDDQLVGVVGEVEHELVATLGVSSTVVGFELDVDMLLSGEVRDPHFRPISTYPPANIDLAFVVDDHVAAADVVRTLRAAGGEMLESVHLFDTFRSSQLGDGNVSLAFALRFRAIDRTLTDVEIAGLHTGCIAAVESAHAARLRA